MNLDKESFLKGVLVGLKLGRAPLPWGPAPVGVAILTEDLDPITTEGGDDLETE